MAQGPPSSLVPRPSITANIMEGLVKLLRRMMSVDVWGSGVSGLCQRTLQPLAHNNWKIDIEQSW